MRIKPRGSFVLIQCLPHPSRSSVLAPTEDNKSNIRLGTVVSFGEKAIGLSVGDKVGFFRWVQEHSHGKQHDKLFKTWLSDEHVLIQLKDVCFVYDGDVRVDS